MRQTDPCRACVVWLVLLPMLMAADDPPTRVTPELRERCITELRDGLAHGEKFVKVHAAEFLLNLGYPQGVHEAFQEQAERFGDEPKYRTGIWRVLARSAPRKDGPHWLERLREACLDQDGPDPIHTAESLAKTPYRLQLKRPGDQALLEEAQSSRDVRATCLRWVAMNSDPLVGEPLLLEQIQSSDPDARRLGAYALRHQAGVTPATAAELAKLSPEGAGDELYRASAAFCHAPAAARPAARAVLERYLETGTASDRYEACLALGQGGGPEELPTLIRRLDDEDRDVRLAAAASILRLERRRPVLLEQLDWLVIALYGLLMIAIGVYYATRTRNAEDFLLGGRNMNSIAVGISLFATLFSSISNLAIPGETIRNGLTYLFSFLSYPLIYLVVGFWLIPFIMRQKVTTAYEILELRFGLSVRLAGSLMFLAMRLLWMAVIIYATVKNVLLPLTGLDPAWGPWICLVLAGVTIFYTSLGGLPAVVVTDVLQAGVLLLGALVPVILVTYSLGGVSAWWPGAVATPWEPVRFWPDPTARMTAFDIMLSTFLWWVCTNGSDQMAVQRYLATRDAPAARRALSFSLLSNVLSLGALAMVGMALLAYFQLHPHLLGYGQDVVNDADLMFPRFIAVGLPAGLSGLIVAGLLAAAMSSLSSGLSAAGSIISVDLLGRVGGWHSEGRAAVARERLIALLVGLLVLGLSLLASRIPGNLLEVSHRAVNLLTAPLFVLFILALFVPWATSMGTLAAAVVSVTTAIGIAFFQWGGLSFTWIMPGSLIAGVITGMVVSLLGRRPTAHGRRQQNP